MGVRLRLAKAGLCLLIGASTLFGFILAAGDFLLSGLATASGVSFLAAGGASLNSLQDRDVDRMMSRTRQRPLPSGQATPGQALQQAIVLSTIGMLLIYIFAETAAASVVALSALLLYNGLYTPLKQKTILAIVPGAICGALPPYIGWLAGGGGWLSYAGGLLVALLLLWQLPHFWLVMLAHKEDYVHGTVPNLLDVFGEAGLKRFFITWIGALAVVMTLFLSLPYLFVFWVRLIVVVNAVLLLVLFCLQLFSKRESAYGSLFIYLNASLCIHMVSIAAGRLLTG